MKKIFVAIGVSLFFLIGIAGQASARPIACWDLDQDHECDLVTEDLNHDGRCSKLDCDVVVEPSCPVPKTGQTISYHAGDDGALEKGVPWPDPRFTDRGDGTVRDNLTGLIWLQNTNCFEYQTWETALDICNTLQHGDCSLTDSSVAGDWRLPNRLEMESLLDFGREGASIPLEPPFLNYGRNYWTSTPYGGNQAWWMEYNGVMDATLWSATFQVWPVRNPQ